MCYQMIIEVLGTGCSKCKAAEKVIRKVVEESGKNVEIVKVEDLQEIINRGVMMTPAIIVDGEVKITGRVPRKDEIKQLIK